MIATLREPTFEQLYHIFNIQPNPAKTLMVVENIERHELNVIDQYMVQEKYEKHIEKFIMLSEGTGVF